ncbi:MULTISPECIES: sigma-70 family RNA polymerase sigma factor [Paenibacillaceae]|uniref:RNA polymerase sigma factor 70 region 4 type 2 domain-containing protein n=2 Tax=Paenibacillaceae TaxID=186822 RepID=A0A511VB22_9BACL|nr:MULTISPECIES: sigma-70 family RNA polymerase sigma factor [Paenibacillaceae]MUG72728.1 hypothetical protein [Paenibacillus validus]GEN36130.1 hypothetical protein ADA01nite_35900 [Aneurinibacillus danicus]
MGAAKEFWFKETERWLKSYPEWKRNLPRSCDLFNYEEFYRVDLIEQALRELGDEERKLYELFYRQNKSYIAISLAMYMSRTTVYESKIKLIRKLAERLGIKSRHNVREG